MPTPTGSGAVSFVALTGSAARANVVDPYLNRPLQSAEVVEVTRDSLRTRQTEELVGQFFEAASDAVVIIDEGGVIVQLNTQTEILFGYRRDELLNQPIEMLVPERLRARHVEHRRAYFRNPLPRSMGGGLKLIGLRKDGVEFPIDIALSPLPTDTGLFVASAVRDMTRQRRLEDELRQRTHELEDADRHKDQFLMTLAHELNSPLAAVAYSAELLRRPDIAAEVRERAARIVLEETNFMQRLVQDLGELPRVQRGDFAVREAPTDLAEVARLAVEISRPLIERHGHALEIVIPLSPIRAQGDAARLAQIVTNLLFNAARYTPEGGRIRLSIGQEDGAAALKVKDNGIGIPKEMLTRVFDLFTRLEGAKQKYAGGMGIGLAFVRRLVEIQGGSVEAFSEGEGQGSEFIVRLPLAETRA
ncbi:MAG: PAS domain-containing sensor histidine kinase [Betaproteobacteria bacterium]|nr:PAS domain-containing sensor histidine kinase [Gammaproteobacteria bacterium]MDH3437721.1 PAS domain-containing sensor histidine kinase [Betaproteobacteria bacterium]